MVVGMSSLGPTVIVAPAQTGKHDGRTDHRCDRIVPFFDRMAATLRPFGVALLLCFADLSITRAEELKDPTRPPLISSAKAGPMKTEITSGVLHSIRLDRRGNLALISGALVKVGDEVGKARVKAIRSNEVVLSTDSGDRVLKLYPAVNIHPHQHMTDSKSRLARSLKSAQVAAKGDQDK